MAGVGLLTLGEYGFRLNFGIDQALLHDTWTDASISPPGRMSIATAFGFFMLGCSLFFLGRKRSDDAIASQILALSGLVAAVFAYLGYVYGVQGLHPVSLYTSMGVHTSTVLIILCAATLLARPDRGAISILTSGYSGGQMARLILPIALTLPFFIGWLQLQGAQADLYGTEFGFAAFATANIILFTILVWISAKLIEYPHLHRLESKNDHVPIWKTAWQELSEELAKAKEKLQTWCSSAASQMAKIIASDQEDRITFWNQGAQRQMYAYTKEETVGHSRHAPCFRTRNYRQWPRLSELGKPASFDVIGEKARNGQHDEREWTYVRTDGQTLTVNCC